MKDLYTHICVVLDASGSMESIREQVQSALVEFCQQQRSKMEQDVTIAVDVYQFSDEVERIVHNAALDELENHIRRYRCCGCTALYDAVCDGIDELGAFFAAMPESERPEDVLFVIVTDGYENASRRFNNAHVQKRIKRQSEKYNWHFVFLASGIDVVRAARDIGMRKEQAYSFCRDVAQSSVRDFIGARMADVACMQRARRMPPRDRDNDQENESK